LIFEWVVIGIYLVGITALGIMTSKKVSSSADFFISDRKFGKGMLTFFTFGTGTNTDQAVTVASKTYVSGASGIWYQWLWLFATPIYWILAPLFRRMRCVTTADYLNVRYGASVAVLFALVGMLQLSVNIGVVLKASSVMVTAVFGDVVSAEAVIFAMTGLFMLYGVAGGLNAAIVTDLIQGFLTVVLSFLLLPFAFEAVGGMSGLRESIADPAVFAVVAPGEITILYITVITVNAIIGWVTSPYSMAMCGAGRSEFDSRVGLVCGMFLKRACTVAWVLTGLIAIAMYSNADPDQVYGMLARDILPTIAPGLVGLFVASMLAAVMSSCDTFMVSSSALFTENIYKPFIRPDESESHYITVGRIASVVVVLGGIFVAFRLTSVVAGLELFWIVQAMMGVAIWASFFWRRATAAGAWASTISGFLAWFLTSDIALVGYSFNATFAGFLPSFMLYEDALSLPWQMIIYLGVGALVMVVVSLMTIPPSKQKLDAIYEILRTPVELGEPEVPPMTLPATTRPAPRTVLIDHPDFELMKPSRMTVVGFVVSCGAVAALIYGFMWILTL
jgi:Na+/proline symporter